MSLVTVTDTYNSTTMGADKAIITDLKDHNSAWCTKNTSGTAKIMVSDLNVYSNDETITLHGFVFGWPDLSAQEKVALQRIFLLNLNV